MTTAYQVQDFVTIQNTSRNDLNNRTGIIVQYDANRERYLIIVDPGSNSPISLKEDKLRAASFTEKAQTNYKFLMHHKKPDIDAFVAKIKSKIPQLSNNSSEEVLAGLMMFIVLVLGISFYFFGFSRTWVTVSLVSMPLVIAWPDLNGGVGAQVAAKNFGYRLKEQVKILTGRDVSDTVCLGVFALMYVFGARVIFASSSPSAVQTAAHQQAFNAGASNSSTGLDVDAIYKLGWEDAKNGLDFGSSLPDTNTVVQSIPKPGGVGEFDDDIPYSYNGSHLPPMIPTQGGRSKLGVGTMMSLFFVGRTLMDLARIPGGFSVQAFIYNVKSLPPWRIAILGLSVYRLISQFM